MKNKIKIVLDLGHGGYDPGAIGPNSAVPESKINLNIGLILKAIFDTHPEYEVIMTRRKDIALSLRRRVELANKHNARLVSIHCNSSTDPDAKGSEVWCFAKENRFGKASEGYQLAQSISTELGKLGLKDRGAKVIYDRKQHKFVATPYYLLRRTKRASVIVECGFISNKEDADKLDIDDDGFNESLAAAIFKGVDRILNQKGGE